MSLFLLIIKSFLIKNYWNDKCFCHYKVQLLLDISFYSFCCRLTALSTTRTLVASYDSLKEYIQTQTTSIKMYVLPEIVLISSGIIGIIAAVILVLIILIAKRRTSTYLYIMETAFLYVVLQFLSPVFHHLFTEGPYHEYDVRFVLNMLFFVVLLGIFALLMLLFLMDYYRCIHEYKFIVMALHAVAMLSFSLFYYFVVENRGWLLSIITEIDVFVLLVFVLIFLLHRDLECFKKRQQTDDESRLRYLLVLIFFAVNVLAVLIFLMDTFLLSWLGFYAFGLFSLGLVQLQPIFFLIVIFKVDHRFRTSFVNFFKMCALRRAGKVEFESMPSDNGQLLRQNV